MQTTICCNADHAHDKMTGRSVTGIIGHVRRNVVLWISKRQGPIVTSTYHAEFMTLGTMTEEAVSLCYMLRCLGVPIKNDGTAPTQIFGNNLSVILLHSPSIYSVRVRIAAGVTSAFWFKGPLNQSNIVTKQIAAKEYLTHCDNIFWEPPLSPLTINIHGHRLIYLSLF